MRRIRYATEATADVRRIAHFQGTAAAARRAMTRIVQAVNALREFPELGHRVEGEELRVLYIPFGRRGAFVVRYRLDPDEVVIARLWHSKEARE